MSRPGRSREAENNTPEKAFGSILRKIRCKRELSQQRLADKSGYHRTYIGLLEHGQKSPSLRTIFDIAATLQLKPSEFLKSVERLVDRADMKGRKS